MKKYTGINGVAIRSRHNISRSPVASDRSRHGLSPDKPSQTHKRRGTTYNQFTIKRFTNIQPFLHIPAGSSWHGVMEPGDKYPATYWLDTGHWPRPSVSAIGFHQYFEQLPHSEISNPKSEISNQKPVTRNQKPETSNKERSPS